MSTEDTRRQQTHREEFLNTTTHGIGAALAGAALALLVVFASLRGDAWRVVSLSVYGAMLVLLYLVSTLYHSAHNPRIKKLFQLLDHSAIFLMIAGTYTPVTLIFMRGPWGWTLFGLIWGLAAIGIVARFLLTRKSWRRLSVALYVAMGWLALIAVRPVLTNVPPGMTLWLLGGGIFYTLGLVFYRMRSLRYHHTIWHLFVLAGSACHFFGMFFYATAVPP
jgi:hemolysin III